MYDETPNIIPEGVAYPHWALCLTGILGFIFAIIGFFGNLLTILALPYTQRLRNAATYFVMNLAVAELLFCLFILPASAVHVFYLAAYKMPLFSDSGCRFFVFFRYMNIQVELLSIAAIAVNRCILISFPKQYSYIFQNRGTFGIISGIWILSFVIMLFPLIEVYGHFTYNASTQECDFGDDTRHGLKPRKIFLIFGFVLPCAIIITSYLYILFKAIQSSRKMADMRELKEVENPLRIKEKISTGLKSREIRIARTILVIFICFMICCTPVWVTHYFFSKEVKYPTLLLLLHPLYWSQYCINVFIYVLMNKQYRDSYINFISSWWPEFRNITREKFRWTEEAPSCSERGLRKRNQNNLNATNENSSDSQTLQ